ncbi:L-aspartate oxidase [bacterium]|jgi:L-aspartate oxidase|nr:L-aspartate oxidase [bacterium]
MTDRQYDFLVVGGGIAGLTYALEVADSGTVAILFKSHRSDSSTSWAQGGIASVSSEGDSFESHIRDTIHAGAGLSDEAMVSLIIQQGPECVEKLIERGALFDRTADGYHLHQEGGHSQRRILHAADATGYEIQRALLAAAENHPNIELLQQHFAIDIITSHKLHMDTAQPNRALGIYVLEQNQTVQAYMAKRILIATGGVGKVYLYTSNPDVATGDGIAMCYRAGVPVANMEFMQFHPTCLYHPEAKNFLITEAMRGEGAHILRVNGERFLSKYDERGELAPRDIVARAIDAEMKRYGEEYVLLDIAHRGREFVQEKFPMIYSRCLEFGFDISTEPVPVVPAAHYCCGGVITNEDGVTNIQNLYAAGEVACTGLHGANRLASNSLLEGLVLGTRAAQHSLQGIREALAPQPGPVWDTGRATDSDEQVVILQNWEEIRRIMWNYVGIVRSTKRLERALRRNQLIRTEIDKYYWDFFVTADLLELRNLSIVADLIIRSALLRKESRGLHYMIDFPTKDQRFNRQTLIDTVFQIE